MATIEDKVFDRLFKEAEIATFTPEELREYEDSLKAYRDIKNSIDSARREGRAEGLAEGLAEGHVEEESKKNIEVSVEIPCHLLIPLDTFLLSILLYYTPFQKPYLNSRQNSFYHLSEIAGLAEPGHCRSAIMCAFQ